MPTSCKQIISGDRRCSILNSSCALTSKFLSANQTLNDTTRRRVSAPASPPELEDGCLPGSARIQLELVAEKCAGFSELYPFSSSRRYAGVSVLPTNSTLDWPVSSRRSTNCRPSRSVTLVSDCFRFPLAFDRAAAKSIVNRSPRNARPKTFLLRSLSLRAKFPVPSCVFR